MKVNILSISNNELIAQNKNYTIPLITSNLYKNGFDLVGNNLISSNYDNMIKDINLYLEQSDFLLCLVENEPEISFIVKKAICEIFNETLTINSYAKNNIKTYYEEKNIPIPKEISSYQHLPANARCITNTIGAFQGFLLNKNQKTIFFMPLHAEELSLMFFKSVLPYLIERSTNTSKTYVFKTFGLTKQELNSILKDQIKNKNKIQIICNEKLLDVEILINVPANIRNDVLENFISTIFNKINHYLYAETDTSMYERAFDLLNINNLTLSIAEDITAGNFSSRFFKTNKEANKILIESYITPTINSKVKILGVEQELLEKGQDYEEVAYEMALGALENSGSDFVVSTTGDIDSGKCYIGIGNSKGIHVYTETVEGDLNQKIEKITSYTFFHLIKKLKQNDFHLSKTKV